MSVSLFHIINKFISLFFIFEVGLVTYLFIVNVFVVNCHKIWNENYSYTIRKENI